MEKIKYAYREKSPIPTENTARIITYILDCKTQKWVYRPPVVVSAVFVSIYVFRLIRNTHYRHLPASTVLGCFR